MARKHGEGDYAGNSEASHAGPRRDQVSGNNRGTAACIFKKKAEQGIKRPVLNHLCGYLTDICRSAVAEGYLTINVTEGLKSPVNWPSRRAPKHGHSGAIRGGLGSARGT